MPSTPTEPRHLAATDASPIVVCRGARAGLIERVTEMHARYYGREHGFGDVFRGQVAQGLAEFVPRLAAPCNGIWLALKEGRILGSIAIDGQAGQGQAHLRWFILDDGCRGQGIGGQLLAEAVAFCDRQGFEATWLWTFEGLGAARRLYERAGFALALERSGQQWGSTVTEQKFVRPGLQARN